MSPDVAVKFDPYQQWLGLPPSTGPYDHYAVLGLERFERNREIISNAAQRKMAQLRKRRTGETARTAQLLIAELSKATTCLLNANRKRLYDHHLRHADFVDATQSAAAHPVLPPQLPLQLPTELPTQLPTPLPEPIAPQAEELKLQATRPVIVTPTAKTTRRRRQPLLLVAGVVAAGMVFVVAGIIFSFDRGVVTPAQAGTQSGQVADRALPVQAGFPPARE